VYKILIEEPEGRDHSEGLGIDGKIMFECILQKLGRKV